MFESKPNRGRFASTQWSLVLAAGQSSSPDAERALSALCSAYWQPLYFYVRRRGYSVPEAQDLTQSFFTRLLEKDGFRHASQERGKFRSFLLVSLNNFLSNEREREQAQKRGGNLQIISLEEITSIEDRYRSEKALSGQTPEKLFERQWALTLIDRVLARLGKEFEAAGKAKMFDQLKPFLGGNESFPYSRVAADLGMTEGALKVAVHRLRKHFRELLRDEIAQTMDDTGQSKEIDDEIRYLMEVLSR
jgi:RNA polymerase sigma factor (sigma-70 family)